MRRIKVEMNLASAHVVIIHGTMGSPEGNWFPWLRDELISFGADVSLPRFPTPEDQNLESWLKVFTDTVGDLQQHHILVGHSIGAAFALRALERAKGPIRGAFFVAGFSEQLGNPEFDPYNKTFLESPFKWEHIRAHARQFKVYNSDNDPYVPLSFGESLAHKLLVDLTIIKGGGHLNRSYGFLKFERLFSDLKEII
jgi:hypothetical protein